uniref:Dihydroorotase n=1 Tax=Rhabditophanes sp. KR3021 TaxID=114890 RepID=A0AC35TVF5_9BILA
MHKPLSKGGILAGTGFAPGRGDVGAAPDGIIIDTSIAETEALDSFDNGFFPPQVEIKSTPTLNVKATSIQNN